MTLREFTIDEQIEQLDAVISGLRQVSVGRRPTMIVSRRTLDALKSIAADLRGRQPQNANVALIEIGRRINAALRSKDAGGRFDDATIAMLGHELIGRWPCVRQALQNLGGTN